MHNGNCRNRQALQVLGGLMLLCWSATAALGADAVSHFRTEKVADNLYAFISPDPTQDWVDGNSYAIITDDGVFVVDAHGSPIVAQANIDAIRKLTSQPVKYLLITHWHWDHNFGAYTYRKAFPDIQIISHTKTREVMMRRCDKMVQRYKGGEIDTFLAQVQQQLASGKREDGTSLSDYDRRRAEKTLADIQPYLGDTVDLECEYPNVTFDKVLRLHMGGTEIQVRHDFRANTNGDAFVWMPGQGVLITGDILVHPIPYAYGGYTDEWIQALDSMIALQPQVILPGHGEVLRDTMYLHHTREALSSLLTQAKAALARGITTEEEMRKAIDMSAHHKILVGDDPDKNWAFENYFFQPAVRRILKELKGEVGDDLAGN